MSFQDKAQHQISQLDKEVGPASHAPFSPNARAHPDAIY